MESVAIIHGNLEIITNYFRNLVDTDPEKKPCWSRLKLTSDGAIAWFNNGKKPHEEVLKFLGQIADLEVISPPYITVWRDGIRYFMMAKAEV